MTVEEIGQSLGEWGFHDSYLLNIRWDVVSGTLELKINVMLSEEGEYREGILRVTGLVYVTIYPPPLEKVNIPPTGWELDSVSPAVNPHPTPVGTFTHCFYLQSYDSFLQFCGADSVLEWIDSSRG